jgi:hypothetical protein
MIAVVAPAWAATSSRSVPSAFGGNGHNASFDGRLFITRTSPGWFAHVLRPEALTYLADGMPDTAGAVWSDGLMLVDGEPNGENALAICEPDPARAPFACDANGSPGGPFACYDLWIFDSDATRELADGGQRMRRRHLMLRVENPGTAAARPVASTWGPLEIVTVGTGTATLDGIEPTMTKDGRLMLWQGADPLGDQLLYSVAPSPCSRTGWTPARPISRMIDDPLVNTKYRLATRQLRAADGTSFAPGAPVRGAYPWLFPDGDAVIFSAAAMPCRDDDDPHGCGPRRNATAVLGYPTNWGIAHIDGGINPSTADHVRLFFSSPGATTFSQLPVTPGHDVWPFFGSNTSNYVEISFDDGLDGKYAGMWHMNESVTAGGELDPMRSPDVSGYFNTARVRGAVSFPEVNNGVLGKAAVFSNGWLEIADDPSLSPISGITMEMTIRLASDPDCNGQNNFRVLLRKGNAYGLVLEETRGVRARVRVAGGIERELYSGAVVPIDGWTKVTAEYDARSGRMQIRFDDEVVAEETFAPAELAGTADKLTIGGVGTAAACPVGGNFEGTIDEVSISRVARHIGTPDPDDPDAGGPDDADNDDDAMTDPGGGCCDSGSPTSGVLALGVLLGMRRRRR